MAGILFPWLLKLTATTQAKINETTPSANLFSNPCQLDVPRHRNDTFEKNSGIYR